MSHCVLAVAALLVAAVRAIPIDNGVVGEPEISCGPTSITVNFNTRNPWEGKLYVKNQFAKGAPCVVTSGGGTKLASIELDFAACGVVRERSLEPRGVNVYVTVIMSFHPTFVTKVDRAVRAKCFYMEADKTVSQQIEVSELTTALATFNVPMPVCSYHIRATNDIKSNPVEFAIVGQSVWHHWICETDYQNTFCSFPYDCKVDDGTGEIVQLLDDKGCALDKNLLDNLEYPGDLYARKESHVFKYADRPNLYFNCQMHVTIKEPGQECPRPQCAAPARGKRAAAKQVAEPAAFVADVSTPHALLVADVDFVADQETEKAFDARRISRVQASEDGVCMGAAGIGLLSAVVILAIVLGTSVAACVYVRRSAKH